MHLLSTLRYCVAQIPKIPIEAAKVEAKPKGVMPTEKKEKKKVEKVNMKAVKIDFPLPEAVQGIDGRINSKNAYLLPQSFYKKNQP